jgi:dipeptidyl aminopeptidase/acylaminoacyl peptidase
MSLIALRIAAGVLAGAALLTVAGSVIGELVATMPPAFRQADAAPAAPAGTAFEQIAFPSTDGLTLRGWLFPADRPDAPAIVYAPATAHDQRSGLSLAPAFHAAGYSLLLFSYRGHGLSDGDRWGFTYGAAESYDLDAAVRYLRDVRGAGQVGVIGYSAGAVSAIISAARTPDIGAVVAVAAFTCVDAIWRTNRPAIVPQALLDLTLRLSELRKGFRRADACPLRDIGRIAPRPLLLVHGTADQRITEVQARQLYDAAEGPKSLWLVPGATHSTVRSPGLDALLPDVIAFLDAALKPEATPHPIPTPRPVAG